MVLGGVHDETAPDGVHVKDTWSPPSPVSSLTVKSTLLPELNCSPLVDPPSGMTSMSGGTTVTSYQPSSITDRGPVARRVTLPVAGAPVENVTVTFAKPPAPMFADVGDGVHAVTAPVREQVKVNVPAAPSLKTLKLTWLPLVLGGACAASPSGSTQTWALTTEART